MRIRNFVIALAVFVVLQSAIVPYLSMANFRPNLPVLVIIFFAARKGSFAGVIAGFLTGLAVDSLSTHFMGLSSFCYSLVGFFIGKIFYSNVPMSLGKWAAASGTGSLIFAIIFIYFYTLGITPSFGEALIKQAIPTALYTWVLGMFWAISPLYERRGGVRLE